jgi:hypothetical protein
MPREAAIGREFENIAGRPELGSELELWAVLAAAVHFTYHDLAGACDLTLAISRR